MARSVRRSQPAPALAKFSRPRLYIVQKRERLFRLLDTHRSHPIIWIAGPPGAGKSTLVASYVEARKLPGIWFQADQGDADPATFFHYLRTAAADSPIRRAKDAAALPVFTAEYGGNLPAFTRRFLREFFALFPPGSLLVVDNFHEPKADVAWRFAFAEGLREIPLGMNLVFLSREPAEMARLVGAAGDPDQPASAYAPPDRQPQGPYVQFPGGAEMTGPHADAGGSASIVARGRGRMSPPGRPKGEYRSAQREGNLIRPPGRPKGEYRSAQREGNLIRPPGRPKGEYRSAQREGNLIRPPGRPKGEYRSAQREGNVIRPPDRLKGEYRSAQREGNLIRPPGRPKGKYRSAQREGNLVRPPGRPKGEYRSAVREGTPMTRNRKGAPPPVPALPVPRVRLLVADADRTADVPAPPRPRARAAPDTAASCVPVRKRRPRFVF